MDELNTVDCRGMRCPMPIVEAGKRLRAMDVGESVEIIATDPAFRADITAFCKHLKFTLTSLSEDNGEFKAIIEK
jgi:tRNA 2-thiouridine synthesizing protein A